MTTAIELKNVSKSFGAKKALNDVTLEVPEGHIFGFLGPNGAGKTTAIRLLMDFIRADTGSIQLLGKDAHDSSTELKQVIGFLSSDLLLHENWTVQTHVDFLGSIKGRGQSKKLITLLNLDTNAKVATLSSGNKQKLAITLAFLGEPKLLIMDEPTRGLDPLLQNQLYELLRDYAKRGGTVFFSSHNLSEVQQLCDNVAVIKEGKIVAAEAMKDILQMQTHLIRATATMHFKQSDFKLPDVEILSLHGNTLHLKTRGSINPLIKVLSKYHLTDLEISHASLEDIFMEYY